MADLSAVDKRHLEHLLGMGSGYVLNFSNNTFAEFVFDTVGRDIYDARYDHGSSNSKANRLRGFWAKESNYVVGQLLTNLIELAVSEAATPPNPTIVSQCRATALRLIQGGPVTELDALAVPTDDRDFEVVAHAVRDTIEKNQPEVGLDRLHTFVVKYVRSLCERRGIAAGRDKALHAIFGEYVRGLRQAGHIEAEMTERILKSSISVLEAFNHVRNNQSLAHDNKLLGYDEALLIFNHIASAVRFLRSLESRLDASARKPLAPQPAEDDIPF